MKVSAVIPTYNSADFIVDAIKSIQNQTCPVDEIIVVDDGSADNTQQIVRSLGEGVRYIRQSNKGPSAARNTGIQAAQGDWIAFLDADDVWVNQKQEIQINALNYAPELKLIAGDMSEVDGSNSIVERSVLNKHGLLDGMTALGGRPMPDAFIMLVNKNFIPTGTVLVNKDVLMEAGLFNENIRYGEDLELWAKISCKHAITCLPDQLMVRRQHANNSTKQTEAMLKDMVNVMRSLGAYSKKCNSPDFSPNRYIADAYFDLGYWYFCGGRLYDARREYWSSIKRHPTYKGIKSMLISLLPAKLINTLRKHR